MENTKDLQPETEKSDKIKTAGADLLKGLSKIPLPLPAPAIKIDTLNINITVTAKKED